MSFDHNAHFRKLNSRLEATADFSKENLPANLVSYCFGLKPHELSKEDLADIHEFAMNAGLEMVSRRHPENTEGNYFAFHDMFHAAEKMAESGGHNSAPEFITSDQINRYIGEQIIREEFYPLLFLPIADKPLILALDDPSYHEKTVLALGAIAPNYTDKIAEIIKSKITLRKKYEIVIKVLLFANGIKKITEFNRADLAEVLTQNLKNVFSSDERPERYSEIMSKVENGEHLTNRRLFLDHFLSYIKTVS
jgi:hypothetical protein